MPRLLCASLLAATLTALAAPAHADILFVGDAGNTTGGRVDAGGAAYANCGVGNQYGNPSMDLQLLGGDDLLRDGDFDGPAFIVPQACQSVGEQVTVGF